MAYYCLADFIVEIESPYPEMKELLSPHLTERTDAILKIALTEEERMAEMKDGTEAWQAESAGICRRLAEGLVPHGGFLMHAAVIALDGEGYAFTAKSGVGKTTHIAMWMKKYGAVAVNGDKPFLRVLDGEIYAYGTPWCGKDGINLNQKWPLGGICFLEQGPENSIRRLAPAESISLFLSQTLKRLWPEEMELLLGHLDLLLREIPVFLLVCRPDAEAAQLSYETMCRAAEEAGL